MALHVTSIEGSRAWYEKVRAHFSSTTDLRYVDIGETGAYSWPRDQRRSSAYVQARNAYQSVLRFYVREREVDGLAVLRRRGNVSAADLERHLQQFKHHAD